MSSISELSSSDTSDEEIIFDIIIRLPKPRVVRDRYNPLNNFDDCEFKCRFRLSKETFMVLLHMIEDKIKHQTSRNNAISPVIQILVALRYYATGAFQAVMGDLIHIHKSTVCRIIKRVTVEIANLRPHFIKMPNSINEQRAVQLGFYRMRGFPRVIGAIDCSHIRIQSPNSDIGEQFRNRKGYFSINVQAVCTSNLEIANLVARWPGSVHDSTIFDNSMLRAQFENKEFGSCVLLGDGGYPCRSYLMTPLLNPRSESEKRYQKSQIGTRNVIERVFGIWKRRFPVLAVGLRTKKDISMATIVATGVLHNLLIQQNDTMPVEDPVNDQELFHEITTLPIARQNEIGNIVRTNLINSVFNN